jgi:3-hydroxybutyryl-CoA dehydrogenase
MDIKNVGVVGCGLMGQGITEVSARSGYQVTVSEATQEILDRGLGNLSNSLEHGVKASKLSAEDRDAALGRIKGTTDFGDFKDCDIVVEAITENLPLKKEIFARLDAAVKPGAILSSNTSCLSVMDMAAATKRPDRVVGTHFFNPVPVMKLLEVIKTIASAQETVDRAKAFGESLGKTVIIAPDAPGFVVNRLLVPYLIDAVRMLEAGVATMKEIDQGMVLGCAHPMGPLTLLDLVGIDTTLFIADAMFEDFKDAKFAAPPLMRKMVVAGRWGRKTGKGFYEYSK